MSVTALLSAPMELPIENIYGHTKKLKFLLKHLRRNLASKGKCRVLDFGCGNGASVSRFMMLPGVDYTGVDIHQPSLDYANRNFSGANARFLDHVPQHDFDVIIYADNLEHLNDPGAFLRTHTKQLVTDGEVLGAVPNGKGAFELEKKLDGVFQLSEGYERLRRLFGKGAYNSEVPYNFESGHLQFFSRNELFQLFSSVGLDIFDFQNGMFIGAPFSERVFLGREPFIGWNLWLADRVPQWMAGSWYFAAKRSDRRDV